MSKQQSVIIMMKRVASIEVTVGRRTGYGLSIIRGYVRRLSIDVSREISITSSNHFLHETLLAPYQFVCERKTASNIRDGFHLSKKERQTIVIENAFVQAFYRSFIARSLLIVS